MLLCIWISIEHVAKPSVSIDLREVAGMTGNSNKLTPRYNENYIHHWMLVVTTFRNISMVQRKIAISPLLTHWGDCSVALSLNSKSTMHISPPPNHPHPHPYPHPTTTNTTTLRNMDKLVTLSFYVLICQREQKYIFTFYVIPPHWHDTGSWNPASSKTKLIYAT